jgi:hypothetical protein
VADFINPSFSGLPARMPKHVVRADNVCVGFAAQNKSSGDLEVVRIDLGTRSVNGGTITPSRLAPALNGEDAHA